jgi:hypothetical protein
MSTENLLCDWSMLSSIGPSFPSAGKMRKIQLSLTALGIVLQDYRRFPVCIFRVKNNRKYSHDSIRLKE